MDSIELLRSHLSCVRIPEPTNRVYKQECCISFDTPRSEGGLFIDMKTFIAFGEEYVGWNYEKTGNPVYFHIKETRKLAPQDRPLKKPTLLAIGVDGGFDNLDSEYEKMCRIVILPNYVTLPFPYVELPEMVRLSCDAILMADGAEKKDLLAAWMSDKKQVSMYAENLMQLNNGVMIPPTGWKCAKCDKTENLWLNLTDGMILCGRKNWDGSGGNNHAVEHYQEFGYPLAVKLGTITADLEGADVFSYREDESVVDPILAQHLAFFGIDFSALYKTEMTTAEREVDQNMNFDWNRIQERGLEMKPLSGPGYTGLVNLGNSCYMSATLQVVFSTRSFCSRYYENQSLRAAFDLALADPTIDLNLQLTKFAHAILSRIHSRPESEERIAPRMLKTVIASSHPEFSTTRQQDALEFFLHFIDEVERSNSATPHLDPSRSFKFGVEDRISCPSGKVSYSRRFDYILSLNIPLSDAVNRGEVEAFQKSKLQGMEEVRPRVPLEACFQNFSSPEAVVGFYSTALRAKTTAIKTTGLTSFPDYLVLHMRRFVMDEGWVPRKLDVYVDVPDVIDITHVRSKGLQPHEHLLPDDVAEEERADKRIVEQLVSMGFDVARCERAVLMTLNAGLEEAMNWLLAHMDDDGLYEPQLQNLISFGFQKDIALAALAASGGDVEKATEWILKNEKQSPSSTAMMAGAAGSADPPVPDGGGRYGILGFVSHMGTSTQCGHYVAHVFKDGNWVIFNDDKVTLSLHPPKDMGYLYFFRRLH